MDVQDHTTHTTHSGHHEGHGVHLCHRCGWPFPNPHPSAKHRRAHKKICGTVEGYTNIIGSEVVSDDDHLSDDDKEKSPSPKVEIKGSLARSEDEFTDAVTEFADTGSAKKVLDRDLFFSFKDAENDGASELLNAVETSKIDTSIEVSEKTDSHIEKTEEKTEIKTVVDSSESNLELTGTGEPVKDGAAGPATEPTHASLPQEAKSIDVMEAGEEKGQESQTYETITEEAKDSEIIKTTPEVSAIVGGCDDNVSEEIKHEIKPDCEHVSEVAKETEVDQTVSVPNEKVEDLGAPKELIQEVVNEPVAVLTETKDLEEPALEKSSCEQIQEAANESVAVLIEKEDLGGPHLEKQSIEHKHTDEFVEKPDSVLTEKDICTPEFVKEPDTVLTEKEDLGGPHLEKQSNEHVVEKTDSVSTEKEDLGGPHLEKQSNEHVVEKPDSVSTEKEDLGGPHLEKQSNEHVVEKPDSVSTEKEDLGAPELEKRTQENIVEEPDSVLTETCSNGEVIEQTVVNDRNLVADVSAETVTLKDSSDTSVNNSKDASVVKEVLSTASIDAETIQSTEKPKVNSEKSNAANSDVYEPPSFMTLVEPEPESKDNKCDSSEVQDSQQQPNSEASQAGWFPTLTEVNHESEGRKKNEEAMAKVTNSSSGKQSTPLKNLLGEARSPSGKQPDPVVQKDEAVKKDEATVNHSVNDDVSSPPKLIEDGKKGRKKVKGISSWVPFACCSSVNAVK
ncbi:putative transcription factor C2H2 family [Helianthus annuus]|nr:putative transcription factor C2H2 family [Helianthus annuus]